MLKSLKTIPELTPFITAFAFVLAFLYLYSYWSAFDINIFVYLSVSNVVIYTAPILLVLLLAVASGLSLSLFIYPRLKASSAYRESTCFQIIFIIYISLWTLWMVQLVGFRLRNLFLIIMLLLLAVVFIHLVRSAVLSDIPTVVRYSVLLVLTMLPSAAIVLGHAQYERITRGARYRYVEAGYLSASNLYKQNEKLRFIGKAGDYFFLLREDGKSIVITQLSNFKSLELRQFP